MRAVRALELERAEGDGKTPMARAHEAVARLEVEIAQARTERSEDRALEAELRRRTDTMVARAALSDQMKQRNGRAAMERATLHPNHGGYAHGGYAPRGPGPGPGTGGGRAAAVAAGPGASTMASPLGRAGRSTPPRSAPAHMRSAATLGPNTPPTSARDSRGMEQPCFDNDSPFGAPPGCAWWAHPTLA